jgi:hypothetical protein
LLHEEATEVATAIAIFSAGKNHLENQWFERGGWSEEEIDESAVAVLQQISAKS